MTTRRDYMGMWYEARLRHGVDDSIHFAVIDPEADEQREYRIPHRYHDGIGALLYLLRQWGVPEPKLPSSPQTRPPPWWRWLGGQGKRGAPSPLPWRNLDQGPPYGGVRTLYLDKATTAALTHRSRELGISLNSVLLSSLHRAVCRTLLEHPVTGGWMYPVNMRGAVKRPRDDMNLSSGFYVDVGHDQCLLSLDQHLREGLAGNRHWKSWHLAHISRWIGDVGVDWLYARLSRRRFYVGSLSSLGYWDLKLTDAGFSSGTILALCGPGSPNHPVSNGAIIVNGRLSLSLKIDISLSPSRSVTQECLECWRELICQQL